MQEKVLNGLIEISNALGEKHDYVQNGAGNHLSRWITDDYYQNFNYTSIYSLIN